MVGDSEADIIAARAAGCVTIGYVNKPGKLDSLAGADLRVTGMGLIAQELNAWKPGGP